MNAHRCCQRAALAGGEGRRRGSWLRRARESAGLIVPGTILALLPKCPLCLAAYVALGTGFSLSYSSAHLLMRTLTALCFSTLAFCAVSRMVKHLRSKPSFNLQNPSTPQ